MIQANYDADFKKSLTKNKIKIDVFIRAGYFKIYIDNLIHISLRSDEIIDIETYDSHEKYYINYHLKTRFVETFYINEDLWKEILQKIDKIIEM